MKQNSTVEICVLLGNYTTYSGNSLQTLQDNLSVPSSRVKNPKRPISCPKTSVKNYQYRLHNFPEQSRYHLLCGRSLKSCKLNCCLISLVHHSRNSRKKIISLNVGYLTLCNQICGSQICLSFNLSYMFGLLGHLQGYHSNNARRFSRLLYS